jgi:hypothetical protein
VSAHTPCTCGRKRGDIEDLVVVAYHCNYSAFNGCRWTRSDYSQVLCMRVGCLGNWRTKAPYVEQLTVMSYAKAYDQKEAMRLANKEKKDERRD